jgi:uncharacterized membrane protein
MELSHPWIHASARVLEYAGIGVILLGAALALVRNVIAGARRGDWRVAYDNMRADLGRGILLGLELLVGADIIATITAPLTFESLAALGVIVLIRTFLSFALATEIEGRPPWAPNR